MCTDFCGAKGAKSPWLHTDEGPDDMPAHIKTAMFGVDLSIPIQNGRLKMGTWQVLHKSNPTESESLIREFGFVNIAIEHLQEMSLLLYKENKNYIPFHYYLNYLMRVTLLTLMRDLGVM